MRQIEQLHTDGGGNWQVQTVQGEEVLAAQGVSSSLDDVSQQIANSTALLGILLIVLIVIQALRWWEETEMRRLLRTKQHEEEADPLTPAQR